VSEDAHRSPELQALLGYEELPSCESGMKKRECQHQSNKCKFHDLKLEMFEQLSIHLRGLVFIAK